VSGDAAAQWRLGEGDTYRRQAWRVTNRGIHSKRRLSWSAPSGASPLAGVTSTLVRAKRNMPKREEESEGATPDKPQKKKVRISEGDDTDAGAWCEEGAHDLLQSELPHARVRVCHRAT
jgi:hypothetical protein